MRVSDLTDHKQINALVAMIAIPDLDWFMLNGKVNVELNQGKHYTYCPTQGNQQTYEVAQKFKLRVDFKHHTAAYCRWDELTPDYWTEYGGKTTALAVCKAVIASEWGDTIPKEVMDMLQ